MKPTRKDTSGTSFHDSTIRASLNQLKQICGIPNEYDDPNDKVQYEWEMQTERGDVFTIYDWKEYRRFGEHAIIEWHIGGKNWEITHEAQRELEEALSMI